MEFFSNSNSSSIDRSLITITFIDSSLLKNEFINISKELAFKYIQDEIIVKYNLKSESNKVEEIIKNDNTNEESNSNTKTEEIEKVEEKSQIIHSFGFFHTIPDIKIKIENSDSMFITYNNYDCQDLDFYFSQAAEILKKNNINSREAEDLSKTNPNEVKQENENGDFKYDLLDDLMEYVDKEETTINEKVEKTNE